jgi:hypothetical protein
MKLSNFCKKVRQGWGTFSKKSGEVTKHFLKKQEPEQAVFRLNLKGVLPVVPKKVRQGCRTFSKKFSRVVRLL